MEFYDRTEAQSQRHQSLNNKTLSNVDTLNDPKCEISMEKNGSEAVIVEMKRIIPIFCTFHLNLWGKQME